MKEVTFFADRGDYHVLEFEVYEAGEVNDAVFDIPEVCRGKK